MNLPAVLDISPTDILLSAQSYAITSPEMRDAADADLALIKKVIKDGEAVKKATLAPIKAQLEAEAAIFDAPLKTLADAKSILTTKIMEWDREQKRLAAARKIEAEKATEKAREMLERAGMADAAKLVAAAPVVPVASAAPSSGTREQWRAEVQDLPTLLAAVLSGQAPAECIAVNQSFLNAQAREQKANLRIPGVTAVCDNILVAKRGGGNDNF